jgi:hypothetical protein
MIDLLNRIGFRQIAFGGEGGGGGGGGKGGAASNNVVSGAPRQAELMDQPHMLAYINPQEEQMLRDAGGAGIPGPDGIPVYGWWSDTWKEITSGGAANTETYNGGIMTMLITIPTRMPTFTTMMATSRVFWPRLWLRQQ